MGKKYKTTVEVDEEIAIKLKEMASNDDRTLTNYIRKILTNHVSNPIQYTEMENIPIQQENIIAHAKAKANTVSTNQSKNEIPLHSSEIHQDLTENPEDKMSFSKKMPPIKNNF